MVLQMSREIKLNENSHLNTSIRKRVSLHGVEFEEDFLSELVAKHLRQKSQERRPTMQTAYEIYMTENHSAHRRKFQNNANLYFSYFVELFGDLPLDELRHFHITQYRDHQLGRGLSPISVRKHNNVLNAMINMAFKHLDIDRLSPFRGLQIRGESDHQKAIPPITKEKILQVKELLLQFPTPAKLVGLIQLNTGMRVSEPSVARLDDLVLDHEIPHLWVRKNIYIDRKTKASIRAVPLVGVSLDAAKELHERAKHSRSEWLVPQYARELGNCSCSATLNKTMKCLNFRSHMFRHAFIDRLKANSHIPVPLAESITGHGRNTSEFANYGSVGYTLEQKRDVIQKILI
jgi:integrase